MKLLINGTAEFDPFGIRFLKHNTQVNETIDLGAVTSGVNFSLLGHILTVGIAGEDVAGTLEVDIKAAVYGMAIYDQKIPVASHVDQGPIHVSVGGPQLGFVGTVQVTE